MHASDVMTTDVVTVGPDASVAEVARLLVAHRISAVPVVDATGRLAGIAGDGAPGLVAGPAGGSGGARA